jgi:hypothetical protein
MLKPMFQSRGNAPALPSELRLSRFVVHALLALPRLASCN